MEYDRRVPYSLLLLGGPSKKTSRNFCMSCGALTPREIGMSESSSPNYLIWEVLVWPCVGVRSNIIIGLTAPNVWRLGGGGTGGNAI